MRCWAGTCWQQSSSRFYGYSRLGVDRWHSTPARSCEECTNTCTGNELHRVMFIDESWSAGCPSLVSIRLPAWCGDHAEVPPFSKSTLNTGACVLAGAYASWRTVCVGQKGVCPPRMLTVTCSSWFCYRLQQLLPLPVKETGVSVKAGSSLVIYTTKADLVCYTPVVGLVWITCLKHCAASTLVASAGKHCVRACDV